MKFSIFNKLSDKNNFRVTTYDNKFHLEFNLFRNYWISSREWDRNKFFNVINSLKMNILSLLIIFITLFFNGGFAVGIFTTALSFLFFYIAIYFTTNEPLKYYMSDEYYKDLKLISEKNAKKQIVIGFDKNGNELRGKELERISKFKTLIR